jgi:hypothetical protein
VVWRAVLLGRHVPLTVPVIGHERANGSIDRDVSKVDTKAGDPTSISTGQTSGPGNPCRSLCVKVGEVAALEERIVGEVHPWHDVLRAESHLLDLGKVVHGVTVERERADVLHRHELLGDELGGVEQVEVELGSALRFPRGAHLVLVLLLDELNAEVPLGTGLCLDGVPKVSSMEIWVLSVELGSQPQPPIRGWVSRNSPSALRPRRASGYRGVAASGT